MRIAESFRIFEKRGKMKSILEHKIRSQQQMRRMRMREKLHTGHTRSCRTNLRRRHGRSTRPSTQRTDH